MTDAGGPPKVTIAHDFAETFGGAERILASIAAIYPSAEVWAILGDVEVARRMGVADRFRTLLPQSRPLLRHYRMLAPLYPGLVRMRGLPAADVLLTSSYAFATGFRTRNRAPQLCYCYSPLRFAWSMTTDYSEHLLPGALGWMMSSLAAPMRSIDRRSAAGVTRFVAESQFVADQIHRFYGRESEVIRPPVDTGLFKPDGTSSHDGYFLFCGRLVEAYKRPSLAVQAFAGLDRRLVIAGDGPALPALRKLAGPNVEFMGHLSDDELVPLMQRAAALVFPSRDDFGLLPVEVMACGRPVLAFAGGGALETVVPGRTGEFFGDQSVHALRIALEEFDPDRYDPAEIRRHAESFGYERFADEMRRAVTETASGIRR